MLTPELLSPARSNARATVQKAVASGARPDERMRVSDWAETHRVVAEESSVLPGPWRNSVAPELVEIMDCLSPEHPGAEVKLMKCSQSGGSEAGGNWLGFIMHKAAGPAMYVGPTVQAAMDWKIEKLDPTISATDVLNPEKGGVVIPRKSRSGDGSKVNRLKFKGGYVLFAGANSAATLRQHSIRFMVRDDRSKWTKDAEGEGNPKALTDARLKTYRRFGLSKVLDISSPVAKGEDIDFEYELSDRRRYYVVCKNDNCRHLSDLLWEDVRKNKEAPFRCHWICPACQTSHADIDKAVMKDPARGACWIPTAPDADGVVPPKTIAPADRDKWRSRDCGRYTPGFHLTGEITGFEVWDELARQEKEAGDDPELQKPFINTGLGRPFEAKGEGPPWQDLSVRREAGFVRGVAPSGALYFTLTTDVQGDGIYWVLLGWGARKECWVIDYGYLSGATDAPGEGAWRKLDAIADNGFRLASGARCAADQVGVDSGFNVDAVYDWVRRRHNALALKGEEGWSRAPIFGARNAEVRTTGVSAGKARKYGLKIWLVGTYPLKGALMIYLGRKPFADKPGVPTGYTHFPADAEEEFFRHLTSEYVKVEATKDGPQRIWARRSANHWLDCMIYGMALTHHAGLWAWDEVQWERRAAALAALDRPIETDLFAVDTASARVAIGAIAEADADETERLAELAAANAVAPIGRVSAVPRSPSAAMTLADDPYL